MKIKPEESSFDFIAIGDTVVDAFIKLNQAEEIDDNIHNTRKLCMSFGDKIPFESVEIISGVGNSPNAAVSASRLGLKTALISNVGTDTYGTDCLNHYKQEGIDTCFINIQKDKITNYHFVLWFKNDRTILIKHEHYNYNLPSLGLPRWIYLSSLGENSLSFHQELFSYLKDHPTIQLVFQPGTFQMKLGTEALKEIYKRTKLFFCNVQEAMHILKTENLDIRVLLKKIAELGPEIVVITDGPAGSYAYNKASNTSWFMPVYPDPKEPYERTGAGDSFASTFTSAIALGKSIPEALKWGSINSMSVVQYVGAQKGLLTQEQIRGYLDNAPEGWDVKEI